LYNFTQPLIRYELNDSVQLAADQNFDQMPFTRINNIQGRTEDILHFPGKFDHEISVHPLTFHRIMDTVSALGWQIVQEPNALTVLIIPGKDDLSDKVLIKAIGDALESLGAQVPPILIHRVAEIPKTSAGKIPLIKAHHS
jgi:phenylacetate-coenzyme A ligase PaaK-like adenylate-forming protein